MRPTVATVIVSGLLTALVLAGCALPDRTPVGPVEIERPDFHGVLSPDSASYEVPLRAPVRFSFSEPVKASSGNAAVVVTSTASTSTGSFSTQDSSLIFTPGTDYLASTVYHVYLNGEIKDLNDNSLSIDPDYGDTTWFLTSGDYSDGGWYPVYTLDKVNGTVIAGSGFDATALADTLRPANAPEFGAVTPDGSKFLVSYKISAGYVTIFDRLLGNAVDVLVGTGPVDIIATNETAFVVNQSGRTISRVDLNTQSQIDETDFDDGFRPRNIAMDRDSGRLFVTSNYNQDPGAFRVLNASDMSVSVAGDPLPMVDRSAGIDYSNGEVYVLENNTGRVLVVDPSDGSVADSIIVEGALGAGFLATGDTGFLYTSDGYLHKLDLAARMATRSLKVANAIKSLDATPAGDLLYAATTSDTSFTVLEPEFLYVLGTGRTTVTSNSVIVGRAK